LFKKELNSGTNAAQLGFPFGMTSITVINNYIVLGGTYAQKKTPGASTSVEDARILPIVTTLNTQTKQQETYSRNDLWGYGVDILKIDHMDNSAFTEQRHIVGIGVRQKVVSSGSPAELRLRAGPSGGNKNFVARYNIYVSDTDSGNNNGLSSSHYSGKCSNEPICHKVSVVLFDASYKGYLA
jgi:hypothetical protein